MSTRKIFAAQAEVDADLVARMIQDFWKEFDGVYGKDVLTSSLCAVGPLHAMIGLAIRNGHLYTEEYVQRVESLISS